MNALIDSIAGLLSSSQRRRSASVGGASVNIPVLPACRVMRKINAHGS
jgi:hypothetical protein